MHRVFLFPLPFCNRPDNAPERHRPAVSACAKRRRGGPPAGRELAARRLCAVFPIIPVAADARDGLRSHPAAARTRRGGAWMGGTG